MVVSSTRRAIKQTSRLFSPCSPCLAIFHFSQSHNIEDLTVDEGAQSSYFRGVDDGADVDGRDIRLVILILLFVIVFSAGLFAE